MKWFVVLAVALCTSASAQTWARAHGGADNAGFADVMTSPAVQTSAEVYVGTVSPGVGPVIGPNGDAYLPTSDGHLVAVMKNGNRRWSRPLLAGPALTSALVGADGTIYVASSIALGLPDAHDHRTQRAWLTKFDAAGNQRWMQPLPVVGKTSGAALALNSTGKGADEMILVATLDITREKKVVAALVGYRPNGTQLFAENVGGSADGKATYVHERSTLGCIADMSCWEGMDDVRNQPNPVDAPPSSLTYDYNLRKDVHAVPVGIAVAADGTIVVSDGYRAVRGYRYVNGTLARTFDKLDARYLTSAPAVLANLRSIYGVYPGRIAFAGPAAETIADMWQSPDHHDIPVEASPTRLANGRFVSINRDGWLSTVESHTRKTMLKLAAQTIAPAAASRNYFYVSTATHLLTFDAETEAVVGRFILVRGGGLSSPAIGADGTVYAHVGATLYIFKNAMAVNRNVEHHGGISPPPVIHDHRTQ